MNEKRFRFRTLDDLRAGMARLGADIPVSEDVSILGEPVKIGRLRTPNRFAVQPMEGFDADADGTPGELTLRRYTRYAAGGFGLIWFEATAVLNEGRSNPHQLWLHKGNVGAYARLVAAVRKVARDAFGHEIVMVIQLTHSGRYSRPTGRPEPIIAHHSQVLDPKHNLSPDYTLVTDDYLDRLRDTYVEAAGLAAEAGLDGVDVKSCHRYLVSELLASFTREGRYGGSFENRTRLLRESLAGIREGVRGVFVTTRMNAYDAISHPYGFGVDRDDYRVPDLAEPLALVKELCAIGIPVINVSIGNPYFNPHYGRPYDFPVKGTAAPEEHPLSGIARFVGIAREIQEANRDLPVVGSGYSWLRQFMPHVAAGVIRSGGATLVGLGRGAFAYPDAPKDVLETSRMDPAKCCVTCSGCTQIMRDGGRTGCVVRDSAIYGPEYRRGRRFALDRLREQARRCRECDPATCTAGCPAGVDVPAFVKAFADGDIPRAYGVLRRSNVLPEMCARVCPSEVQCEGGCLEGIFCRDPVPIRDIQLAVSRLARERGLVGVAVPDEPSGRKVAVVGGGPAGIAAAVRLIEKGHSVTILERDEGLGGAPDGIIPAERYAGAAREIDAVLAPAREAGRLAVGLGRELGRDVGLEQLRNEYDAVLLALGLAGSSSLGEAEGVPETVPKTVTDALTFLRRVKSGELTSPEASARATDGAAVTTAALPDKVAVLGGGNTAMDAAVAARELGATDVYLVYRRSFAEMPAWPSERDAFLASGGHLLLLTQPVGYVADEKGRLTALKVARTELGEPDDSGRRRPMVVPGSESELRVGLVIEALGQGVPDDLRDALPGLTFTKSGLVRIAGGGSFATGLDKVFAAGDLVNGGTTAVQAIAEGMKAADEIDRDIQEGEGP